MRQKLLATACLTLACTLTAPSVMAWGDEGHKVVALIASHYLQPKVLQRVNALLQTDSSKLTPLDLASEATWADYFRDSDRNTTQVHYLATHNWHYADIEIPGGTVSAACYNFPVLTPGQLAANGPANDCVIDKVSEFAAELKAPATTPAERLAALQFLLHFMGDMHQPLHDADEHDLGGNSKTVVAANIASGSFHHYWDVPFVEAISTDALTVANQLIAGITSANVQQWASGTPTDWAREANAVAVSTAYGALPKPDSSGVYHLSPTYVKNAVSAVKLQLSRAGVRLATVLNNALQ